MVKSYTLKIKGALEIAHRVPDYEGACSHLHGHCMHYILNFKGKLQDNGMVEDFKFLKEVIEKVMKFYDHTYLNDFIETPTLENFATIIVDDVNKYYDYCSGFGKAGKFISIEMWETDKYGVVVKDE